MKFKDARYRYQTFEGHRRRRLFNTRRRAPPSRSRLRAISTTAGVLLLLAALYLAYLHVEYRRALSAKYAPTLFDDASSRDVAASPWQVHRNGSNARPVLRDHRGEWARIGGGYEGEVFVYGDTVIKTFATSHSPLRNCMRFHCPATRMPAEVQAMYVLGGQQQQGDDEDDEVVDKDDIMDFVPIRDYFLQPGEGEGEGEGEGGGHPAHWYLLMPYLPSGHLGALAKRLRRDDDLSYADVDLRFRPSLNRMLGALGRMHEEHGLCHDDIKLENIFVAAADDNNNNTSSTAAVVNDTTTRWIFADLGNVREIDHPYHSSRLWIRDGHQHADCRVNDVVRLLKTYTAFLRMASSSSSSSSSGEGEGGEKKTLDTAFWGETEPWSKLYWSAVRGDPPLVGPSAARMLRRKSEEALPPRDLDRGGAGLVEDSRGSWSLARLLFGLSSSSSSSSSYLEAGTLEELRKGMGLPDGKARILGLTRILGLPVYRCG
ncbi:hypothetical protein F4778DRAFT_737038 [Xylariomycetidae sp. FL2044]|nr:hypothetical protein F4778DRAFT_737038 [Xylariomycetidae sp. FL2044]